MANQAERNELDEILENFLPEAQPTWEGWQRITSDDLKDYQGRQ